MAAERPGSGFPFACRDLVFAKKYDMLAALLTPSNTGVKVVVLYGPPASMKSSSVVEICQNNKITVVDSDAVHSDTLYSSTGQLRWLQTVSSMGRAAPVVILLRRLALSSEYRVRKSEIETLVQLLPSMLGIGCKLVLTLTSDKVALELLKEASTLLGPQIAGVAMNKLTRASLVKMGMEFAGPTGSSKRKSWSMTDDYLTRESNELDFFHILGKVLYGKIAGGRQSLEPRRKNARGSAIVHTDAEDVLWTEMLESAGCLNDPSEVELLVEMLREHAPMFVSHGEVGSLRDILALQSDHDCIRTQNFGLRSDCSASDNACSMPWYLIGGTAMHVDTAPGGRYEFSHNSAGRPLSKLPMVRALSGLSGERFLRYDLRCARSFVSTGALSIVNDLLSTSKGQFPEMTSSALRILYEIHQGRDALLRGRSDGKFRQSPLVEGSRTLEDAISELKILNTVETILE